MKITDRKKCVLNFVDENEMRISDFHQEIWRYAEPAWREYASAQAYVKLIQDEGFRVNEGSGDMPTAFCAVWGAGKPVIGGNAGGIPLQITYGKTGYLFNTAQECANRIAYLLQHPQVAERMGQAGKEHVRQNFLITRYLRDYLKVLNGLSDQLEGV